MGIIDETYICCLRPNGDARAATTKAMDYGTLHRRPGQSDG
jgi:hypothetical protein